jgi:hypothetical protein
MELVFRLTTPWRFESFSYSLITNQNPAKGQIYKLTILYCRMLKLADKPSCLGGGDPDSYRYGIKQTWSSCFA